MEFDGTTTPADIRFDFEASIEFLTPQEGGRQTPFVIQQLYRPDFCYKHSPDELFMIWPTFIADDGSLYIRGAQVDTRQSLTAYMTIIDKNLRALHRERIQIGTRFYLMEGLKLAARGEVKRIVGLETDAL